MTGTTDATRVVVVEDEAPLLEALVTVLTKEGFEVHSATDGVEGLQTIMDTKPDVVIADILMPNMNGADMIKQMRAQDWGKDVPVIILTNLAANSQTAVRDMIEAAPEYYLMKVDWSIHDVVAKVREVVAKHGA